MKKKTVTKKLNLNKSKIVSLNEMQNLKGGATVNCLTEDWTCRSMCDFSCWHGTCQG